MKLPLPKFRYCIDTNALIDLDRRYYPPDIFKELWDNFEEYISRNTIIAPKEVLNELTAQRDRLSSWAKKHRNMFKNLSQEQGEFVKDILRNFPDLVDYTKTTPDADPYVIALARSEGCAVITIEKKNNDPKGRPKIPNVCEFYGVRYLTLIESFREFKWKF